MLYISSQVNYVTISDKPSPKIIAELQKHPDVQAGGTYRTLGYIGKKVSLVDKKGSVVSLPYDDSFSPSIK